MQDSVNAGRPGEPEHPVADGRWLHIASTPRSVAEVRRYCVDSCLALGWADTADTVELLVSEVATNAIVHAPGPSIRVRVLDRGVRLRVEVADDSLLLPASREARADAENGRGLALVDALAVGSGVDISGDGKTIWFEVGI